MILTELPSRIPAIVESVEEHGPQDAIAQRLRELGFVNGEEVEVVAKGPLGAEPLLVQVGFTRFALRRSEAARIRLRNGAAA
ncbi:MAG: FeoA domain-containing protein [Proteobacteria bacterium]|nr:FeoA domain-containing protein [Pseudomonadota bacterium]